VMASVIARPSSGWLQPVVERQAACQFTEAWEVERRVPPRWERGRALRQILGLVDLEVGERVDSGTQVRRRVPKQRAEGRRHAVRPIEVRIREDSTRIPRPPHVETEFAQPLGETAREVACWGGRRGGKANSPAIAR